MLDSAVADELDIVPKQYQDAHYTWGQVTNRLRAGIVLEDSGGNQCIIDVVLLTYRTNALFDYVKPKDEKFARCELVDPEGKVVNPLRGMKLDAELPDFIQLKDLPMTPKMGRNNPLPSGLLILPETNAITLKRFVLQDIYPLEKSGEYVLSITPAVYRFSSSREYLTRSKLGTIKVKLQISP